MDAVVDAESGLYSVIFYIGTLYQPIAFISILFWRWNYMFLDVSCVFLNLRYFFSAQSILGFKMPKKLQMFLLVMLSDQDSSSSQWWIGSRERPWGLVNNLELWIFYMTSKVPRCLFSRYILMELPSVGYCWFPIRWRSWRYQGHFQKDRHRWWWYCFYWRTEEWSSKVWFTTWRVWSTNAYWSSKSCLN